MPPSPRPAPVSGGVCALHPPHRRGRPSHTPPSAPPTHPWSPAGPRHLPTACLRRSNPHRRISLRFRPTRFLSTVAAVVSGPHPRAVAPRRHTKNALRLRHMLIGDARVLKGRRLPVTGPALRNPSDHSGPSSAVPRRGGRCCTRSAPGLFHRPARDGSARSPEGRPAHRTRRPREAG